MDGKTFRAELYCYKEEVDARSKEKPSRHSQSKDVSRGRARGDAVSSASFHSDPQVHVSADVSSRVFLHTGADVYMYRDSYPQQVYVGLSPKE